MPSTSVIHCWQFVGWSTLKWHDLSCDAAVLTSVSGTGASTNVAAESEEWTDIFSGSVARYEDCRKVYSGQDYAAKLASDIGWLV